MKTPVNITFRHTPASEALSNYIREQVDWLAEHEQRIDSCHVVVEPSHGNAHQAKRCRVRVDVHVPGATLVSNRVPTEGDGHDDPYLAVRQAFETLRRQLDARHERRASH